jgi:hypothetical protein
MPIDVVQVEITSDSGGLEVRVNEAEESCPDILLLVVLEKMNPYHSK